MTPVVADAALERANGTLAIVEQAGLDLAGPALGGLIFATSAALPFGLNAAGLIIGAALIARIPLARRPAAERPAAGRPAAGRPPVREFLSEGARRHPLALAHRLRPLHHPHRRRAHLLHPDVAAAPGPARPRPHGPVQDRLRRHARLGAISGAAGAAATPFLVRRFEHRVLQVLALVATSAGVLALAAFPTPVIAALVWGDTGFTFALWNVLSVTLRQRLVPPGLLGRVNSASRTLSTSAVPLGALAGGAVADVLGLRAAFWLSGLAVAVLAVVFRLTLRGGRPPAQVVLRHDDPMQPNLARIPSNGDARAQAILRRAQPAISQQFLDVLDERDCLALGRYGTRQPTVALRNGSAALLREALLAAALGQLGRQDDPRDVMVSLALHHVVAQKLGLAPPDLFNEIAARLPDGPTPDLLRVFGARQDVSPDAFGWQLIQTPEGPDFIPQAG